MYYTLTRQQENAIRKVCKQLALNTTYEERCNIVASVPWWELEGGQIIPPTLTSVYQLFRMVSEDYFIYNGLEDWDNHPNWLTDADSPSGYTLADFLQELVIYPYFMG